MLFLLSQPFWKTGEGIGKVLEFAGEGVRAMGLDERATLTNMAVEAGGFTGIIEADEDDRATTSSSSAGSPRRTCARASCAPIQVRSTWRRSTSISSRSSRWSRRRVIRGTACPLRSLDEVAGGPSEDRHRVRRLVHRRQEGRHGHVRPCCASAVERGKRVADGVHLYIQFGSQDIRRYAEAKGYLDDVRERRRRARRPLLRRVHQGRPRRLVDRKDQVTVSRHQPQLPGTQRTRQGLPGQPPRRRGERDRGEDRISRNHDAERLSR